MEFISHLKLTKSLEQSIVGMNITPNTSVSLHLRKQKVRKADMLPNCSGKQCYSQPSKLMSPALSCQSSFPHGFVAFAHSSVSSLLLLCCWACQ